MDGITLGPPVEAGPSRQWVQLQTAVGVEATDPSRKRQDGSWLPLPYIHTGFVIHPHNPAAVSSSASPKSPNFRNRFSWSGVQPTVSSNGGGLEKGGVGNIFELSLDVGDELFAFEEYKSGVDEDARGETWYRGSVVPRTPRATFADGQLCGSTSYS